MGLAEFLELSAQEKMQQIKIFSIKKQFDFSFFYRVIKNMDPELLFRLAMSNPEIDKICKSPELSLYWEDVWRQCGVNPQESAALNHEPVHEYQPMCTVTSCFDLLKGLYLYESYRKIFKEQEYKEDSYKEIEEFLAVSGLSGCFFALNALCKGGLYLLEKKFDESTADKVVLYANIAANCYFSPGYLLLANTYQELLKYKNHSHFLGLDFRLLSFQAMSVAKRLEPFSAPMLNNAYQGKTLSEASDGLIDSFSNALMRSQKHLELSPSEVEIATSNAITEVSSIKKKFKLESLLEKVSNEMEMSKIRPRSL